MGPAREVEATLQLPYKNAGSQSVMPGQMYMNTRHRMTISM
jgi:hypothetical protein